MRTKGDAWTSLPPPPLPPPPSSNGLVSSSERRRCTHAPNGRKAATDCGKLRLDLYNFDAPRSDECPYILTSPRSLEACRRTGIKPIDLLPTTVAQLERELVGVTSEHLLKIFVERERRRLANLERCRLVREEVINLRSRFGKLPLGENSFFESPPLSSHQLTNTSVPRSFENKKEFVSRKEQLDKENKARTQKKIEAKGECSKEKSRKNEEHASACHSKATPAFRDNGHPSQRGVCSTSSVNGRRKKRRGSSGNRQESGQRAPPPAKKFTSQRHHSGGKKACDSRIDYCSPKHQKFEPASASAGTSIIESSTYNLSTSTSSPYFPLRSSRHSARDGKIRSHQDLSCRSSGSSGSLTRQKQVSFRGCHASLEDIWPWVPEHDRRILQSMALRREDQREREEMAHRHHLMWEAEVERRKQELAEEERRWKEWVGEKRKRESEENAKRWEEVRKSLMASQAQLQQSIEQREERSLQAKEQLEQKRKMDLEDKSLNEARKLAGVLAARCQMAEEEAMWQHTLEEELQEKLKRAERTKTSRTEGVRRRVASANRAEELRHLDRWHRLREEEEEELERMRIEGKFREERAKDAYRRANLEKERIIKEQCLERDLKTERCHQLHKELEDGLEAWRGQVVVLQEAAAQRAMKEVARRIEEKRQHIGEELNARRERHNRLMNRITAEEEARKRWVRESIRRKEERIKRLGEERGAAMGEARERARATAFLRDSLRRALSPDTFDRRAARVAIEARLDPSRPPTASPTMNRSHIHLG